MAPDARPTTANDLIASIEALVDAAVKVRLAEVDGLIAKLKAAQSVPVTPPPPVDPWTRRADAVRERHISRRTLNRAVAAGLVRSRKTPGSGGANVLLATADLDQVFPRRERKATVAR